MSKSGSPTIYVQQRVAGLDQVVADPSRHSGLRQVHSDDCGVRQCSLLRQVYKATAERSAAQVKELIDQATVVHPDTTLSAPLPGPIRPFASWIRFLVRWP